MGTLSKNHSKNSRGPLDRHLDVLHHPLTRRPAVPLLDPVGDAEALV